MKRREYNHTIYSGVKKTNGILRDKLSPSVGEPLKVFGIIGQILCWLLNLIIVIPLRALAFAITGLFYNKRTDKPYKGSFIYTGCFILLMFLFAGIVKNIIVVL